MTTVLILEDNELQLEALVTILEQNLSSISILKASNYETARTLALNHSVQFFLLDVELDTKKPDSLTGVDFGKYLRTLPEYEFVPILFITSIPDQIQTAVNQIHCQSYILKPYTPGELLEAVHFVFKIPNLPAPKRTFFTSNPPAKICSSICHPLIFKLTTVYPQAATASWIWAKCFLIHFSNAINGTS